MCRRSLQLDPARLSASLPSVGQGVGGKGREGERCWGCPSAPTPPPLPQSRDRTLFRVAIRHLFSNLISSELYFPSLRKIIFHRSRARPLPRTAAAAASIYLRAEPGRAAARAGELTAPRRSEGGGGRGGGRETAGEEGAQRHGPLCPDPEPGSQLPASHSLLRASLLGYLLCISARAPRLCFPVSVTLSQGLSDPILSVSVCAGLQASHFPRPAPRGLLPADAVGPWLRDPNFKHFSPDRSRCARR